ncbi:CPBP family glutamic-type intramembrane protease [Litorihabitans aurantiacus]|uniref:CAAX prenyl protease 2/Lysostaphin resistance protein A-like domain-containing protein n=1 Tax=Litorihabitans aurantiacus TaxID=1930061 RepID=A0AA37XE56_9MICO|nr:CPBP family glutamic-type intramembrane protease [Litorihabitans aurantiacus]GMA31516.1 hypothetical protein GCM10025875_15080 [Litorihabitans aurantiacus]
MPRRGDTPGPATFILGRHDVAPRIRVTLARGLVVTLAAAVLTLGLQLVSGTPYRAWGSSDRAVVLAEVVPLVVSAVFLVAFVVWSQWDAVWRDPFRMPTPVAVRVVVAVACGAVLARAAVQDFSPAGVDLGPLLAAAVLGAVVHEVAVRGVLLRALRVGRRSEMVAAWTATAASALPQVVVLVLVPSATGRGLTAVADVAALLALGALLHLVRRTTRRLLAAVGVHAVWNVGSQLERAGGGASTLEGPLVATAALVLAVAVVAALATTLRRDPLRRALVDPRLS